MFERLDRLWRIFATGLCFVVFGVAGLVMGVIGYPAITLVFRQPERRTRAARNMVRRFFGFFIELMRVTGCLDYELHDIERLQRPGLLILANHPSLIDVIFIVSLVPEAVCVVKQALYKNPFTRGPVTTAGYITNDGGLALVEDCKAHLAQHDTLVIFPEGTRTPASGEVNLQRGAANIAIRCRKAITPVSISSSPRGLTKYLKWYQVPVRRMHFVIRAHEDLQVEPFLDEGASEPLAVRRLNTHLKRFFEESGRATS